MTDAKKKRTRQVEFSKEVETLLNLLNEFAEGQFDRHGEVMSMFVGITADNELITIPTPWTDEDDKRVMLRALRLLFRVRRVVRYGMISEVWLASYKPDEVRGSQWPEVQPRHRPDRDEAVMIQVVDPPTVLSAHRAIIRPWDGSKPTLGPLIRPGPNDTFSGRMTELLDD